MPGCATKPSKQAAKVMGIAVQPLGVREPDDFEQAFAAIRPAIFEIRDGDHPCRFSTW
jgi:hypothetical protein